MTILYAVIARGSTVLCSHQTGAGNFDAVMCNVLPNIPTTVDAKTSYTSTNNVTLHVMVEAGIVYLCASESDFGKRQPYAFLNEIKQQFMAGSLGFRAQYATEAELDRDFQPVLATQMERFSAEGGGAGNDQITTLQSQVEEVKGVMTQNIERVLERGQRLDELMDKTTDLEANAATFKKTSHRVHRKMWWRNTRWTVICALVAILVVGIIILIILFATGVLPASSGDSSSSVSTSTTTTTTAAPGRR